MTGFGPELLKRSLVAISQATFLVGGALLFCDFLCRLIYVYYGVSP